MTVSFQDSLNTVINVSPDSLKFVCNMREQNTGTTLYAKIQDSLDKDGILYPIVVNQHGEIVDGHCRLQYAKDKGLPVIPAIVRDIPTNEIPLFQYRSFDRQEAGSTGVSLALQNYIELNRGKTNQEIADLFGVSTATVSFALSIERKIPELKPLIKAGKITPSTAKVIAQNLPELEDRSWEQTEVVGKIAEFVEEKGGNKPVNNKAINNHLKGLGKSLESVSTGNNTVNLQPKREKKLNASEMLEMIASTMVLDSEDSQNAVISAVIPKTLYQILLQIQDKENPGNAAEPEQVKLGTIHYKETDVDLTNAQAASEFFKSVRGWTNDPYSAVFGKVGEKLICDSTTYFAMDSSSHGLFQKLPLMELFVVSVSEKITCVIKESVENATIYQFVQAEVKEPATNSTTQEETQEEVQEEVVTPKPTKAKKARKPKTAKTTEATETVNETKREEQIEKMLQAELSDLSEISDEELEALLAEDLVEDSALESTLAALPGSNNDLLERCLEEMVAEENPEYEGEV